MKPDPLLNEIERVVGRSGGPQHLRTLIESQLFIRFSVPKIVAAEEAEDLEPRIAVLINKRCAEAEDRGLLPVLCLFGTTSDFVMGYSYPLPSDTKEVSLAKRHRQHAGSLLSKLKSLTFSEFEVFGKKVLSELGASRSTVTAHSNDQGIDFFGELNLGQFSTLPANFLQLAHDVKFLFAGQAKHYPNRAVGPDVVRELVGAVSLARTKTFSSDGIDIFAQLDIRPFTPVVALLLTTGRLSSGAVHLSKASGVVAKSGEQLAVFLADRGVGMCSNDGMPCYSDGKFEAWLRA